MKLTPLDIHHKEFRHSLRGYAEEEVDQFLDEVADEFERLFKENIDLSEKVEAAQQKVNEFELQRHTINNTLMAAQRSADEIVAKAKSDADGIMRDADTRGAEIVHNALAKKQAIANELIRIKQAEEEFRARYKTLLEHHLKGVSEIALPDDVDVLLGDTNNGTVGQVSVRPAAPSPAAASPVMAAPVTATAAAPEAAPAPVAGPEPAAAPSGTVHSVALGEMSSPDVGSELQFVEPTEFSLPSFEVLGERDEDDEIEEID